jgi:hypothetical protein
MGYIAILGKNFPHPIIILKEKLTGVLISKIRI